MPVNQGGIYQSGEQRVAVKATKTSGNQTLTTSVSALVTFAGEDYDTNNMHDNVTNNSRLTCIVPGLYLVGWSIPFAPNATGIRTVELLLNGSSGSGSGQYALNTIPNNGGSTVTVNTQTRLIRLSVGDYLELRATQNSGGNLDIYVHTFGGPTDFWAVRLGS